MDHLGRLSSQREPLVKKTRQRVGNRDIRPNLLIEQRVCARIAVPTNSSSLKCCCASATSISATSCRPSTFAMAEVGEFPRELLILMFILCPDIRTAARLAVINQEHHEVWLNNVAHITKGILEPEIPFYEGAAKFTITESRLRQQRTIQPATTSTTHHCGDEVPLDAKTQAPAHLWVPRLLENAARATSLCVELKVWLQNCRARSDHANNKRRMSSMRSGCVKNGGHSFTSSRTRSGAPW